MSKGEMIGLVCLLCLLPLWAAGSIVLFALGAVRCGRLIDPYYDGGGSDGEREQCPVNPLGPRDDPDGEGPEDLGPGGNEADWWPRFERDLGTYVAEQESCPSGHGATSTERNTGASGTHIRA